MGMFDDLIPQGQQQSARQAGMFDDLIPNKGAELPPAGGGSFPTFLKQELQNADVGTRNIAAFGTALSNAYEGLKQFVGQGDPQQIQANKIIEQSAPVGAAAGNAAMMAVPFGLAGNSIKAAAAVGAGAGALEPVQGDQSAANIATGKLENAALGAGLGAAGQGVANTAGGYVAKKLGDFATQAAQNSGKTQLVNDALDLGLKAPPSSVNPTFGNWLKESIGGKTATAQTFSNSNSQVAQDVARKVLGLPDNAALSPELLQQQRNLAYQVGYKPVADLPAINWDPKFVGDIKALSPASVGGAVKDPAQEQVDDLISSLTSRGQWTGPQLLRDIQLLRNQSSNNFRAAAVPGGNPGAQTLAHVQDSAADALENLAERNIAAQGGDPNAIEMFRQARQYIAQTHTIEDAMLPGSNTFVPGSVPNRVVPKVGGDLGTVVQFAKNFPAASKSPAQVGGPAVSALRAAMATPAGLAAWALGGPVAGGVAGAAQIVAPYAMRAYLGSGMSQNALRDIYQLGLPTRMTNRLLQYAPIGSTVLGLNALSQ